MTRLPYSYQAQIMGMRSFEKMYTAEQMREYAKRAASDEREACAKVCEGYCGPDYDTVSDILAAQIRARGNNT